MQNLSFFSVNQRNSRMMQKCKTEQAPNDREEPYQLLKKGSKKIKSKSNTSNFLRQFSAHCDDNRQQRNKSENFKSSSFIHNKANLGSIRGHNPSRNGIDNDEAYHDVSESKSRYRSQRSNIFSTEVSRLIRKQEQNWNDSEIKKKPFFKLPKIQKESLNDLETDDICKKLIAIKKSMKDPFGCSKSIHLEKVRLKKKIMGEGPLNKMIFDQFLLKSEKNTRRQSLRVSTEADQQKYLMKVYGQDF